MKKPLPFLLIIVVLLIVVSVIFIACNPFKTMVNFNPFKKYKIGHFQSDFVPHRFNVSFDYPIFENWRIEIQKNRIIYLPGPSIGVKYEYPPSIVVSLPANLNLSWGWQKSAITNPYGVLYVDSGYNKETATNYAWFYVAGFSVDISIPRQENQTNFSGEVIWQTVVNSLQVESWITEKDLFPSKYQEAIVAVIEELQKNNEIPAEFYAQIERDKNSTMLIFHLWHQDAFKEKNLGVVGNPDGKSRDMYYDPGQKKVIKTLFWQ